jgi:hypothetical protein
MYGILGDESETHIEAQAATTERGKEGLDRQ